METGATTTAAPTPLHGPGAGSGVEGLGERASNPLSMGEGIRRQPRALGIHSPAGTGASLGFGKPESGRRQRHRRKPTRRVLAQGPPSSRSGPPYPEVLVPVLAQLHIGVAAQRLQEAAGHSAQRSTRTPPRREEPEVAEVAEPETRKAGSAAQSQRGSVVTRRRGLRRGPSSGAAGRKPERGAPGSGPLQQWF